MLRLAVVVVEEVVDVNSVNPVSFTGLLLVVSKTESLYENILCCFFVCMCMYETMEYQCGKNKVVNARAILLGCWCERFLDLLNIDFLSF